MLVPTEVRTERLLLRQLRLADLDAYTAIFTDPEGNAASVAVARRLGGVVEEEIDFMGGATLVFAYPRPQR